MENFAEYAISDHCKQRYAERIMGRDLAGIGNARQFAVENEEKIHADINKLIEYGTLIFSGQRSQKDGKGDVIDVYLRDCWVVLVDNQAKVAVFLHFLSLHARIFTEGGSRCSISQIPFSATGKSSIWSLCCGTCFPKETLLPVSSMK